MKCANCEKSAIYTVVNPATTSVSYCARCLPAHLRSRASAGHFPLDDLSSEPPTEEDAPTPKKRTRTKTVHANS